MAFVRVLNEGLVDLNRATLMLTEVCGAQQIILLERELDLYAQETQQILASMSPASEQSCLLRAEVKDQNGFQMLVVDKEFSGTATNETSLVVQVFGLNYQISLYILLAFLVLIMGLTTYTIFRH